MTPFIKSLLERAAKTALQVYLTVFTLAAGLGDTEFTQPNADAFDHLFDLDNLKAAVVGFVLSVLSSLASRPVGPDGASLVVAENDP